MPAPPIVTAEIKYRCPGLGIKRFVVVGPTAAEAIRKAARFDPTAPGVPRYIAMRCTPVGVELVQRRQAGFAGAFGGAFGGAMVSRKRRKQRRRKAR